MLALAGEWLGHAITWWLSGGVAPGRALSGPMHSYLGPVGAVLALLALVASYLTWRGLQQLARLTASLRRALNRVREPDRDLRDQARSVVESGDAIAPPGPLRLWVGLFSVQVAVYVAQENIEIHLLGLPAPGLHVLTAHSGLPLLVHGVVAFAGAVIAISVLDRWGTHLDEALHVARLYVTLAAPQTPVVAWPGDLVPAGCPVRLFGLSFLSRPPPAWMVL